MKEYKSACGHCGYEFRNKKVDWCYYKDRELSHFKCLKCDHITYLERIGGMYGEVLILETIKNSHILSDEYNRIYKIEEIIYI